MIPTMLGSSFHADQASGSNGVYIDVSHVSDGYVAASVVSSKRLKFQVVYGDMKYNYDLPSDGTATVFPLQSGDGTYQFRVMENTSGTKYRELYAVTQSVSLKSQFQPFLRPSQYVNYNAYSSCVAKARQLASTASNETEVIAAVYAYITENVSYDYNKAATVQSGYLPNPDSTLSSWNPAFVSITRHWRLHAAQRGDSHQADYRICGAQRYLPCVEYDLYRGKRMDHRGNSDTGLWLEPN